MISSKEFPLTGYDDRFIPHIKSTFWVQVVTDWAGVIINVHQ